MTEYAAWMREQQSHDVLARVPLFELPACGEVDARCLIDNHRACAALVSADPAKVLPASVYAEAIYIVDDVNGRFFSKSSDIPLATAFAREQGQAARLLMSHLRKLKREGSTSKNSILQELKNKVVHLRKAKLVQASPNLPRYPSPENSAESAEEDAPAAPADDAAQSDSDVEVGLGCA